jgi:hypothetical protein
MVALPGAKTSIDQMASWADRQGYSVIRAITDETAAVTASGIAEELRPLLDERIDRIVIYFVGHGFLNSPDQIWILSVKSRPTVTPPQMWPTALI